MGSERMVGPEPPAAATELSALHEKLAEAVRVRDLADHPNWSCLLDRIGALQDAATARLVSDTESPYRIGEGRGQYHTASFLLRNLDRQALARTVSELEIEIARLEAQADG